MSRPAANPPSIEGRTVVEARREYGVRTAHPGEPMKFRSRALAERWIAQHDPAAKLVDRVVYTTGWSVTEI